MAVTYFSTIIGIEKLYWRRDERHLQTEKWGSFEVIKTAKEQGSLLGW